MNRLHHLKETLVQNIEDNKEYPNIEFVILDYNSSDGLEEWVKKDLHQYIVSGVLKFYRTTDNPYFDRSHSRNVLFRLASGDIVCNIDADNFAGKGFASYVNECFQQEESIYLVADTKKRFYFLRNAFGRFCVRRSDYLRIGGLDEEMKSYGSETVDLYERLALAGLNEKVIEKTSFLQTISHGDEERISNEVFLQTLAHFYIRFISQEESEFLILYNDFSFDTGFIVPEREDIHLPASLKENTFRRGQWSAKGNQVVFSDENNSVKILLQSERDLMDGNNRFYELDDRNFLLNVAKNYSFIANVDKQRKNKIDKNPIVNQGNFGRGKVSDWQNSFIVLD